jgi:hypothetical protein
MMDEGNHGCSLSAAIQTPAASGDWDRNRDKAAATRG